MTKRKSLLSGLGLLVGLLALGDASALACGDKLVVVGRGMRPKRVKGGVPARRRSSTSPDDAASADSG